MNYISDSRFAPRILYAGGVGVGMGEGVVDPGVMYMLYLILKIS